MLRALYQIALKKNLLNDKEKEEIITIYKRLKNKNVKKKETEYEEMMKYYTLGWYVNMMMKESKDP